MAHNPHKKVGPKFQCQKPIYYTDLVLTKKNKKNGAMFRFIGGTIKSVCEKKTSCYLLSAILANIAALRGVIFVPSESI